jgi:hypothetical protein
LKNNEEMLILSFHGITIGTDKRAAYYAQKILIPARTAINMATSIVMTSEATKPPNPGYFDSFQPRAKEVA